MKSRKETILDCSARLFRIKGYRATSMRDIAQEVGMEAASLYNHISSKQELLRELLMHIAKIFTEGMGNILQSNLSPNDKLERIVALHIRFTLEYPNSISIIASEWIHLEEPALKEYISLRNKYEKNIQKIIAEGIRVGDFEKVDTEIAMFSILSTLRWLYTWYSNKKKVNPVELEQQMIHCLIGGLRKG